LSQYFFLRGAKFHDRELGETRCQERMYLVVHAGGKKVHLNEETCTSERVRC